jgi:peroxiredoxin
MAGLWIVAFVLQWVLLLLLTVLMVGVLRYLGFIQQNIHLVIRYASRFEQGDRISHFELPDLEGLSVVSKTLLDASQRTLLLFLNTSCSGCKAVIRYLADLIKREGGLKGLGWSVVAIYTGPDVSRESVEKHIALSLPNEVTILVDEKGSLLQQYDLRGFPVGIAVDSRGQVIDQSSSSIVNWLDRTLHISQYSRQAQSPISIGDQG